MRLRHNYLNLRVVPLQCRRRLSRLVFNSQQRYQQKLPTVKQRKPHTDEVPFSSPISGFLDQRRASESTQQSPSPPYFRLSYLSFKMADRRRINGPVGTTNPPIYDDAPEKQSEGVKVTRSRPANVIRKMCKHIEDKPYYFADTD